MGMMLTGKPIAADEAHALGIVNEVVPLQDLPAAAERWANEILECSPTSVRATKQVALQSQGLPLEEAMNEVVSDARRAVRLGGHDGRGHGLRAEAQAGVEGEVSRTG